MAGNVEKEITKELSRLRMWRDVANPDEAELETELAHDRINELLNEWEAKHSHGSTKRAKPVPT
jgi:hypothetical protein